MEVRGIALGQGLHGGDGGLLIRLVDRGGDVVAAGVDLLAAQSRLVDELLAHHLQQVAVGAGVQLVRLRGDGGGHGGLVVLGPGDVAVLEHVAQDALEAGLRLARVDRRVPGAGGGQDAGEQGRLRDRHLRGGVAEVRLRGGLDAVGAAPEVDRVEVGAEDLLLGQLPVDLNGHDRLLELAQVGAGRIDVVVLDVLLGQGGGALAVAPAQIVPQGADDALGIDAVIGVEGAVLTGDDGVADIIGDRRGVDNGAVDLREGAHLGGAVRVEHGGGLGLGELAGLGDLDRVVGDDEGRGDRRDEEEEAAEEEAPAGDPAHDGALAGPRVVDDPTTTAPVGPARSRLAAPTGSAAAGSLRGGGTRRTAAPRWRLGLLTHGLLTAGPGRGGQFSASAADAVAPRTVCHALLDSVRCSGRTQTAGAASGCGPVWRFRRPDNSRRRL